MLHNKKMIVIIVTLCSIIMLLLYICYNKNNSAQNKVLTYNTFFENNNLIFLNSQGDIYIPTKQDYLLNLYFKTDIKSNINLNSIITKDAVIDFKNSDINIVDYTVTLDQQVENGYVLNLYLKIDKSCTNKINKIYINNKILNIGELIITSYDNNDFIIKSNVATGSKFVKYFADFTNSSSKDINITSLSCGSLDIANQKYEVKNKQSTYSDNIKISGDKNEIYTLTVYFDRSKVSSDIEIIYVSPRFSYELDGVSLIYYFPYCTYLR